MGKTYNNYSQKWEETSGSSGKHKNRANKIGGMKTLNSYVEEEEYFDDDIEISDSISIQHTNHTK